MNVWSSAVFVFVSSLLCACLAHARLHGVQCDEGSFWSSDTNSCTPCSTCGVNQKEIFPCQPFQDTVCRRRHHHRLAVDPPALGSHAQRLAEQEVRAELIQANRTLQADLSRMERLVTDWQTAVFVVSMLTTVVLVVTVAGLVICRTRTAVKTAGLDLPGLDDLSHLIQNDKHVDRMDQGSLAFVDCNKISIGRRPVDGPYSDTSTLCRPVPSGKYGQIPSHDV